MYCKECGKELSANASFCKSCGASNLSQNQNVPIVGNEEPSNVEKEKITEQIDFLKGHKIFYSNNEILIDTLGSGFLSSLFVQEKFGKSVLFCSNKRVYQQGKLIERNFQGKITYYNGERSVDLREITGMTYLIDDPVHRFKLIAPVFLLGFLGLILSTEQRGELEQILIVGSIALLLFGFGALITYGLKKGKYFAIEYAGGMIMTNCNWYSKKSIKRFMRNVAIQKDKIFE